MKHLTLLSVVCVCLFAASSTGAHAAPSLPDPPPAGSYDDVLVVINANSAVSEQVGSYFAAHRNIPDDHIARITVPTREEISDAEFAGLRSQLEHILTVRKLTHTINYIVTTKGMPLKIRRDEAYAGASVESELTLILGRYAANIGQYSRIASPYFGMVQEFSRARFDIYLVTRLDGSTPADVLGLIDRAAPSPIALPQGAHVVLDQDPMWNETAGGFNEKMETAAALLRLQHAAVTLNTTREYVTRQTGVVGYVSWGSADKAWAGSSEAVRQDNTYVPGAIGELYAPADAGSFAEPETHTQPSVAAMIAEGITGVKGYVDEPFASALSDPSILFPAYLGGCTLAEAFYRASPYLSWMDVVLGDPKCRLAVVSPSGKTLTHAASSMHGAGSGNSFAVYPNPFNASVTFSFTLEHGGHATVKIYSVVGREIVRVFDGVSVAGAETTLHFDASSLSSGMYVSVLRGGTEYIVRKVVLSK